MDNTEFLDDSLVAVTLPSGRRAMVSATGLGGEEQVSATIPSFSAVLDTVREMCTGVVHAIDNIPGKKVTAEFGLSFGMESGQLVTLFAKASANASLKITIELSSSAADDGREGDETDPDSGT
jgi:hypothetical protein